MINSTTSSVKEAVLEDNALLAAYLEGESPAFDHLVRRYQDRLVNYINGIVHDYDQAIDLTQETFIRVLKNAHRYEGKYKFSTWLYRIATNVAIDELRGRNKKGRVFFRNVLDCFKAGEEPPDEEAFLPDLRFCPGRALEKVEKAEMLRMAISSLAETYRVPFLLKEIEDLSYEEVSHVLNLPEGTVKSRVHRAKLLLREKLQGVL